MLHLLGKRFVLLLGLAVSASCGGSQSGTVDGDRVAARTGEILFSHLEEVHGVGSRPQARSRERASVHESERALVDIPDDGIERHRVDVDALRPGKGAAEPLVTIVEFTDFQCPFCERVNSTLDQILRRYPDQVRIVFRNNPLPFHQDAPLAHQAAMEAFQQLGEERFWQFHDLLFQNQRNMGRAELLRFGRQVGMNVRQLEAALDQSEHADLIAEDQAIAARIGARGTPNFRINGRALTGAQPFEAFQAIIDEEIASAERLQAAGVARADIYATLMERAVEGPAPDPVRPNSPPSARPQPDPAAVYRVPITGAPTRGRANALVTVVIVSDFECPFCNRVVPTLEQVAQHYGNDVRFAFLNNPLPFHQNAGPAAQAALEIHAQQGDAGFWRFHDILFQNFRALSRAELEGYAQQVGANMPRFRRALDRGIHQARIDQDQQLVTSLGATGTPSFFINGRNLRGAQPFVAFQAVIDEELAKARALVRAGTPRGRVYQTVIRGGHTSQQMLPGTAAAPSPPSAAPTVQYYQLSIPRDAPARGRRNAPVTVQVISDFECPFCGRVTPTLAQIEQEYGNRVRIVWRHFPLPFHTNAPLAHEAALEAQRQGGDTSFWAYHDILFQNQRALARADLESYAQQLGLNVRQFRQALDQNRHQARVQADIAAVQATGARIGTPSFLINGRLISGAVPFQQFKTAIDDELAGRRP